MRFFSMDFPALLAVCKLVGCKHKTKVIAALDK
jgi:hypothetical protein